MPLRYGPALHLRDFGWLNAVSLPSVSLVAESTAGTGSTTRSVSGLSIGAAAATRSLIVAVSNANVRALASLTITPKTGATTHAAITLTTPILAHAGATGPGITWYAANVPDGTTANFAATYTSDPFGGARFAVFRAIDLASLTAVDAKEQFVASPGTAASVNLTTLAGGIICAVSDTATIASQTGGTITGTETFTDGATINPGSGLYSKAGHASGVAAATNASAVSSTFGLGGNMRLSAVSMR